ncbi:MAG: DUF4116 domain-containing protein [Parcubacteria group bacterium]|nr:DUF4116 domain-containing protein [Parcubacteria group bacterium]
MPKDIAKEEKKEETKEGKEAAEAKAEKAAVSAQQEDEDEGVLRGELLEEREKTLGDAEKMAEFVNIVKKVKEKLKGVDVLQVEAGKIDQIREKFLAGLGIEGLKSQDSERTYAGDLRILPAVLKDDEAVVRRCLEKAYKSEANLLKYASERLRGNKELVLKAIDKGAGGMDSHFTESLPESMRADKEVMLRLVARDGFNIMDASEELKRDKDVCLEAVRRNGRSIMSLPEEMRNDRDIMIGAVTSDYSGIELLPENAKDDKEIIMAAMSKNGKLLSYASDRLRDDIDVALVAIKNRGRVRDVSDRIKKELKDLF